MGTAEQRGAAEEVGTIEEMETTEEMREPEEIGTAEEIGTVGDKGTAPEMTLASQVEATAVAKVAPETEVAPEAITAPQTATAIQVDSISETETVPRLITAPQIETPTRVKITAEPETVPEATVPPQSMIVIPDASVNSTQHLTFPITPEVVEGEGETDELVQTSTTTKKSKKDKKKRQQFSLEDKEASKTIMADPSGTFTQEAVALAGPEPVKEEDTGEFEQLSIRKGKSKKDKKKRQQIPWEVEPDTTVVDSSSVTQESIDLASLNPIEERRESAQIEEPKSREEANNDTQIPIKKKSKDKKKRQQFSWEAEPDTAILPDSPSVTQESAGLTPSQSIEERKKSDQREETKSREEANEDTQNLVTKKGKKAKKGKHGKALGASEIPQTEQIIPTPVEPGPVESTASQVEPVYFEPASDAPIPVAATHVEPLSVEPTPVDPTPVEPTSVEPTPVEPTPVESTPVEPTPAEPTPAEPTPVELLSSEPQSVKPESIESVLVESTSNKVASVESASFKNLPVKPTSNKLAYIKPASFESTLAESTANEPASVEPVHVTSAASVEPTTTIEPAPAVEPTPAVVPAPAVKPALAVEPAPIVELASAVEPVLTVEPTSTVEPAATDKSILFESALAKPASGEFAVVESTRFQSSPVDPTHESLSTEASHKNISGLAPVEVDAESSKETLPHMLQPPATHDFVGKQSEPEEVVQKVVQAAPKTGMLQSLATLDTAKEQQEADETMQVSMEATTDPETVSAVLRSPVILGNAKEQPEADGPVRISTAATTGLETVPEILQAPATHNVNKEHEESDELVRTNVEAAPSTQPAPEVLHPPLTLDGVKEHEGPDEMVRTNVEATRRIQVAPEVLQAPVTLHAVKEHGKPEELVQTNVEAGPITQTMPEVLQAPASPKFIKEQGGSDDFVHEVMQASISPKDITRKEEDSQSTREELRAPVRAEVGEETNDSKRDEHQAPVLPQVVEKREQSSVFMSGVRQADVSPEAIETGPGPNESTRDEQQASVLPRNIEKEEGPSEFISDIQQSPGLSQTVKAEEGSNNPTQKSQQEPMSRTTEKDQGPSEFISDIQQSSGLSQTVEAEEGSNDPTQKSQQEPMSRATEKDQGPSEFIPDVQQSPVLSQAVEAEEGHNEPTHEVKQVPMSCAVEEEDRPSGSMSELLQPPISPVVEIGPSYFGSEVPQASMLPVFEKEERPSESASEVLQASMSPNIGKGEIPRESMSEVAQTPISPGVEKAEPKESIREAVHAPVTPEVTKKEEEPDDSTQASTRKGKGKKIKGSKAAKIVESNHGAQTSSSPVLVSVSEAMPGQNEVELAPAKDDVTPSGQMVAATQQVPTTAESTREEDFGESPQIPIKKGKGKKDKKRRQQLPWEAESDTVTTPDIPGDSAPDLGEPIEKREWSEQTEEPKKTELDKEEADPVSEIPGKKKAKKDKKKRQQMAWEEEPNATVTPDAPTDSTHDLTAPSEEPDRTKEPEEDESDKQKQVAGEAVGVSTKKAKKGKKKRQPLAWEEEPPNTILTPDVPVGSMQDLAEPVEKREGLLDEPEKHASDKQKETADEAVEGSAKKVKKGKKKRQQTAWEEELSTTATPDDTVGFPQVLAESIEAEEEPKKAESDKMEGTGEGVEVSAKKAKKGKKKRQQLTWAEEPNTNVMLDASASSDQDPAALGIDATLPSLAALGLTTTSAAALTVPKEKDQREEPVSHFPEIGSVHSPQQEGTVSEQIEHSHDQPQLSSGKVETDQGMKAAKADLSQESESNLPGQGLLSGLEKEGTVAEQAEQQSDDQRQIFAGVETDRGVKATLTYLDKSNLPEEPDPQSPEPGCLEREGNTFEQPDQSHEQPQILVEDAETDKGLEAKLTGHTQQLDPDFLKGGSLEREGNVSEQREQLELSHEQPQIVDHNAETDKGLKTNLTGHRQEPDSYFPGGSLERKKSILEQAEQYHQQPLIVVEDAETDKGLKRTLSHPNENGDHAPEGQEMEQLAVPEGETKQFSDQPHVVEEAEPLEDVKAKLASLDESEPLAPMSQNVQQLPGPEDPIKQSYNHSQAITGNAEPVEGVKPSSTNPNESALHAAVDQEMEQLPGPELGMKHEVEAGSERNRDSGIQFSEQTIPPEDPSRAIFRDSGYIPSPIARPGWDETGNHSEAERPPRPLTLTSSSEDLKIQSRRPSKRTSDPDFTEGGASGTGLDQDAERSGTDLSILGVGRHREPSPVDSTTKDRSSALFNSPPSNRFEQFESEPPSDIRHPSSPSDTHQSPSPSQIIEKTPDARDQPLSLANQLDNQPEEPYRSIFGPPPSSHDVLDRPPSPPRTPLQTIPEDDRENEKSPSLRRRRSPSNVASPTRSHTSIGRSMTPNAAGRSTPELQPAHKKLRRSAGSPDIGRASSGSEHSERPHRLMSPALDVERSATPRSWHSGSGIAAATTAAAGLGAATTGPGAAGLGTATAGLGAAGLGAAGLGAAVLLSGSRDKDSTGDTKPLGDVALQPTPSEQRRATKQLEVEEGLPSSSTYDPVNDKGKEPVRGMADVYVSFPLLHAIILSSDFLRRTAMAKFQDLPGLQPDHQVFKNVEACSK